jgi:hypothetical protein
MHAGPIRAEIRRPAAVAEMKKVFMLSPARSGGKRANMLVRPQATFELARQVQINAAAIGDVFAFCSGLYFRGKLAYARRFTTCADAILVITPTRGLTTIDTSIGPRDLAEFASVPVASTEPRFTTPLRETAEALSSSGVDQVILLGSVGTGKYLDTLLPVFGDRLLFPSAFLGLGDMSRGAMLLRAVAAGEELLYAPVTDVQSKRTSREKDAHPFYETA